MDKEFDFELGDYGKASIDVNLNGKVKVDIAIEVDLIAEVKKLAEKTLEELIQKIASQLAEKTATPLDDTVIAYLEKLVSLVP